jgi:hypothetical protein
MTNIIKSVRRGFNLSLKKISSPEITRFNIVVSVRNRVYEDISHLIKCDGRILRNVFRMEYIYSILFVIVIYRN